MPNRALHHRLADNILRALPERHSAPAGAVAGLGGLAHNEGAVRHRARQRGNADRAVAARRPEDPGRPWWPIRREARPAALPSRDVSAVSVRLRRGALTRGDRPWLRLFPPLPPPFYRGRVEATAAAPAPWPLGVPPRPLLHGGSPAEAWRLRAGPTGLQLRDNNQDGLCPSAGEGALCRTSVGTPGRGGNIRGIQKPWPWPPDRHQLKILSPSWRRGHGVYGGIGGGEGAAPPSLLAPASGVPLPPPPLQPEAKTARRGHTGGHTSGDASGRCALYS
ncbi:hypothetical protein NDU88_005007 [Pleurodeles waltl]|uniref:Uncharacterized protein n=1 Tax=Pleurodeles waltl TaxID=8319 RepID=A0AAV7SKI9_PLEWA|nr:hypothetical protein NDU88_005007 [Pleurodeles waltl]